MEAAVSPKSLLWRQIRWCWRPGQVYSARVGGPNRKFRRRCAGKIGTRLRSTLPRLNPNPRQLHLLVSAFRLIRSWQEQSCLPK